MNTIFSCEMCQKKDFVKICRFYVDGPSVRENWNAKPGGDDAPLIQCVTCDTVYRLVWGPTIHWANLGRRVRFDLSPMLPPDGGQP